ncbi:hypothetical protein SDRG_07476 [Saprolegnia diclina VS20]|uniref:60S ribosomal export protein NMD3 n=1 Tax=Saprolegnia diclina (strain VS20) TaxID=1156394 RepID=T0RRV8_SAPDV|nr:hypothetical protein SDRG_07476 [Saprolegnia diclina VS20]EQC35248.1 hypothetical protein SDRG_07476 [Saprolegnia diclina VS20]|eukprot:XP_008611532.1 hypothetical protein SDRG_07476 [Saprolegnia diclina VS20]
MHLSHYASSHLRTPWKALVQVRRSSSTPQAALVLDRVLADADVLVLEPCDTGFDLYFADQARARTLVTKLHANFPCRTTTSRTVGSAAVQHTHLVEVCPLQRYDLVVASKALALKLNLPRVVVVARVSHQLHLIDPSTGDEGIVTASMYFRDPPIRIRMEREPYIVLDAEPVDIDYTGQQWGPYDGAVVELEVASANDLGVNDTRHHVVSHLGKSVDVGDKVYGYDLRTMVFGLKYRGLDKAVVPDIILVGTTFC